MVVPVRNCGPNVFDASDCGVRGAGDNRKQGASGERMEGRDRGKNSFSGEKGSDHTRGGTRPAIEGSAEPAAIESEGPAVSASRGEIGKKIASAARMSSAVSDSNRGGTGPAIVGSAESAAIESKGPAGSVWRGRIGEKNCFSGEKGVHPSEYYSPPSTLNIGVLMGSGALVLVWSHPSVIVVRAYLMSVQRGERSQPWRDRASDSGVRGSDGDRKRGAYGERLEGRDRGKN
ncbi:Hypothetical predicted protein [Olea europaea subsp. europaea]|uniref:Uncharacterized protein n=1 Tax=Olea europaea subsp. europaea TaxID=158383 RepID=A0A8S0RR02_OLEEU|nr:Hypothetical predicted protein [Olea europaea subsp. europaea]